MLLLTDGCESEAIVELAASGADKARPWSSISATADQALTDAGIVVTAERVAIAALRRRALAVEAGTAPGFWVSDFAAARSTSTQLDALMSDVAGIEDMLEVTIIPEREPLMDELRNLASAIAAYTADVLDEPDGHA